MNIKYTITFHTYWHCGSGLSASADVDALPIRDSKGLPYVPGKTIKGLVREAIEDLCTFNNNISTEKEALIKEAFGYSNDDPNLAKRGKAFFSNAELPKDESTEIIRCNAQKYLFQTLSNTAIDRETGIADSHTLRKIDVTIPCQLSGIITGIPEKLKTDIENALLYIKRIGSGRNRGLGRCSISFESCDNVTPDNPSQQKETKLQFKCTLLSDIILNQKAATTGPNNTLDFIPGSNFLGLVADSIYQEDNPDYKLALDILHSGKVRFGDAHPALPKESMVRGLHVPASMYYPKLEQPYNNCYIHHHIPNHEELNHLQLKQCRSGFYDFSEIESKPIKTEKTFAIKSAYDSTTRRSKDEQMFGYESLQKGLILLFEIEADNEDHIAAVQKAFPNGNYRIGRSRSAQYGQVKIERCSFKQIESQSMTGNIAVVYADARLIFIDKETGQTTFHPTPEQLGFDKDATILWDQCQIRTFQYAPFNYKRKCFDTDRCGIEKGSVFVVRTDSCPNASKYIGSYCNEGFGKVIYNPEFLQADKNGKAIYKIQEIELNQNHEELIINPNGNSMVLNYMSYIQQRSITSANIYTLVNNWVYEHRNDFFGKQFASQWGTIRSMANQYNTKETLYEAIKDYTSKGVAKDKWSVNHRQQSLLEFIDNLNDNNVQKALTNLAAEMAKIYKKEDR